jgi:hypothetical protein
MTKRRMSSRELAISSQANPAQPVLSAQRGRRQNRPSYTWTRHV